MANNTSLIPLRHMLYGEMRYWVTNHIHGLRVITTRRLGALASPVDTDDLEARIKDLDEQIKRLTAERDRLIKMKDHS